MLWDADALNLLAGDPHRHKHRIITPHPGEAARLLNCGVADIEADRILAARRLVKRYGGVAVLKGAGTVIASEEGNLPLPMSVTPGWPAAAWAMCSPASSAHCKDSI